MVKKSFPTPDLPGSRGCDCSAALRGRSALTLTSHPTPRNGSPLSSRLSPLGEACPSRKFVTLACRVVGLPVSCRHPLVMTMQTVDILNLEHRPLLGWLHRS